MKTQVDLLNDSIALLQNKQHKDLLLIKAEINNIIESVKPGNLLKTAREEVVDFVYEEGKIFIKMVALGTKKIGHKILGNISKNSLVKFLKV